MGVDMGLYDPYIEPELWEPPQDGLIGLLPSSGIPSGRCMLDGIPVFCSDAEHLLRMGAAEFEKPTAIWDKDRWRFVDFNRDKRKYETEWVFSETTHRTVVIDGETSGKFTDYYSQVTVASDVEDLFRMFAFRASLSPQNPVPTGPPTPTPMPAGGDVDLSAEQRKIVEGVTSKIRELLKNDACRELIQGILDDKDFRIRQAVPELDRLENNRGITYFHGIELNAGSGSAIAAVRGTYTGFGRSSPRIVLGYYYFQESVGPAGKGVKEYWGITTDEARVLVLIHELNHHLTRQPHTGSNDSDDVWNQKILQTCMGITRSIPMQ